jgi:hypothetical protein
MRFPALEPADADGTPDLIRGPVVETKRKRPTRSRRASAADEDELGLVAAK